MQACAWAVRPTWWIWRGNKRTDYTAVSNTVIGVLLLATGGPTAAISLISEVAVILVLGAMGFAGMLSALRLKEVTEDERPGRPVVARSAPGRP